METVIALLIILVIILIVGWKINSTTLQKHKAYLNEEINEMSEEIMSGANRFKLLKEEYSEYLISKEAALRKQEKEIERANKNFVSLSISFEKKKTDLIKKGKHVSDLLNEIIIKDNRLNSFQKDYIMRGEEFSAFKISAEDTNERLENIVSDLKLQLVNVKRVNTDIKRELDDEQYRFSKFRDETLDVVKEYRRTQKNDRAKIKRDADMYTTRMENSRLDIIARKKAEATLAEVDIAYALLLKEKRILELKLKRKAPVKKKRLVKPYPQREKK